MFRPRTIIGFRKHTSLWLTRTILNTLVSCVCPPQCVRRRLSVNSLRGGSAALER